MVESKRKRDGVGAKKKERDGVGGEREQWWGRKTKNDGVGSRKKGVTVGVQKVRKGVGE